MRTNLPKLLDLLIFCMYSLNFRLEFFIMILFVTNQLNIDKFLPPQLRKLTNWQFSKFLLIVLSISIHRSLLFQRHFEITWNVLNVIYNTCNFLQITFLGWWILRKVTKKLCFCTDVDDTSSKSDDVILKYVLLS